VWVITSKQNKRNAFGSWLFGSVQLKFALSYIAIIMVLLLVISIYSLMVSRDIVRAEKRTTLRSQVLEISASLGGGEALSEEAVGQAMGFLNIQNLTRLIVTDADGEVLYDTDRGGGERLQDIEVFPDLARPVFSGNVGTRVAYSEGSFHSWAFCPIMSSDGIQIGAVFLYENDMAQGMLITGLAFNLQNLSIAIFIVALLLAIVFSRTLTKRLTEMLSAMRIVGRGDYSYKLDVRGRDELAELGQAFNKLTGRLEETEEMRRRFVSDASHELKTPLASIQLLSDSIVQSEDMDESTVREFVEDIGQEAERLARTTERLLRLTRLDAAPETEVLVPVDVGRVVRSAGHMLEPLAKGRQVEMVFDLVPDCLILATEDDIYQIVFNLAENGIKYNVTGGTLSIRLDQTEGQVRLIVEDTGIGIPVEDMPYIFDRFYRVDKARARVAGGSGLGLSIVRDTVHTHGGTVEVASRAGGGVRFVVKFPAVGEGGIVYDSCDEDCRGDL